MDKTARIESYKQLAKSLRCPLCGKKGRIARFGGFLCEKKHTFDLASRGYLNFAPGQDQSGQKYTRALFESRRRLFSAGLYAPVLEALQTAIVRHAPQPPALLVDAGCGEGYYLSALHQAYPQMLCFGLDLSRDAVRLAATEDACYWAVADLKHLPLAKESVDVLLNILTPADYAEFSRVLRRDGLLLKIAPGPEYLREIRVLLGLDAKQREESQVSAHFARQMKLVEEIPIYARHALTPEQAADFLRMTPLTFDVDAARIAPDALSEITLDLRLLVGRRKR